MSNLTKIQAYQWLDSQENHDVRFLANVIRTSHTDQARKLKGLVNLLQAGHTAKLAQFKIDVLLVNGEKADWSVLNQWAHDPDEVVKEATRKLIAEKKRWEHYNVEVQYAGVSFSMAITTFDDRPFNEKEVHITAHQGFEQKHVAILTPLEAGYTEEEVNGQLYEKSHPRDI